MKKILFSLSAFLMLSGLSMAQHAFNAQNARQGEEVEYCHSHVKLQQASTQNPAFYQAIMQGQQQLNAAMQSPQLKSETIYTIPVVFHVIHNGGGENISDEQIFDAVSILNRDYRRLNADANAVAAPFLGMPADVFIEFKLATKAPNGTCFKGITRTQSPLTIDPGGFNGGAQQLDAIFDGNDVYQGNWPHNKYLNIVVAKNIGGAAGYTMYPNDWGTSSNTIFILSEYVGSIGTGMEQRSRALTHEVGHWLNLQHVWGNDNNPGVACGDDLVNDTPETQGFTFCAGVSNADVCNAGVVENYENYMDYSYCSKMFTPDQVTRMRAAIINSVGGRDNLWTTSNLQSVGAVANPPLCKADFYSDKQVVCEGSTVQFTDDSYNGSVTSWTWAFEGGTPATASTSNPSVVYNTPGVYEVSLTASDGSSVVSETKTTYITVLGNSSSLPFLEGFESYNTMNDASGIWFIENSGDNETWEITSSAANSGNKSAKINNFTQDEPENVDELISSGVDLSNEVINDVTLSFRYAYRKANSTNNEYIRVYFTGDCGDTWVMRKFMSSSTMSSTVVGSSWTPTAADWKTVHIPFNSSAYQQYLVENFRYKFRFEGDGGNNVYLDDINIYNGAPSDDIVLGVDAIDNVQEIKLYPNPSDGNVNVSFNLKTAQQVSLNVTDLSGKVLETITVNGTNGGNVVMLDNTDLATGMYLIQVAANGSTTTLHFVKK